MEKRVPVCARVVMGWQSRQEVYHGIHMWLWSVGIGDMSTSYWEYGYGSRNKDIVPRGCTCEHGVEEGRDGVGGGCSVYVRSYGAGEHHKEG